MTANGNGEKSPSKLQARLFGKIVLTLENCLLPESKLKQTPSQQDGLDRETETDLRILGCELIQTAGILLKLPQIAMATGQVLFQRFFYSKSFVRHSMEVTAMSCICLASKIEEAPRKIRDVINVFHHIKQVRAQKPIIPMILDQNYITLKSQVIKAERRVLKELGFCVHVKHPHKLIVMYLQVLGYEKHQKLMQMAWNFMNDSFRTDVFVRFHPETIACACIYLTARKLSIPLPNNPAWYTIFKVSEEQIIDISYRISALYRRAKLNVEKLDAAVNELMKKYMESRNKNRITGQNTPPITVPAVPVVPALPPPPAAMAITTTTTAELGRGAHNAWGGFISRSLPAVPLPTEKESTAVKRSSRSKSRSPRSHSPIEEQKYSRSSNKKTRHRSRTPSKSSKKRSRNYSRSSSGSPHQKREKKSDKKNDRRSPGYDRDRYTNGDRGMDKESRDRGRDRDKIRGGEKDRKHDRYSSNSKGSGGGSSNAGGSGYKSAKRRDRSKDRRR